ncbi:MAG: polyketide synthase [Planctomycetota bacterium]
MSDTVKLIDDGDGVYTLHMQDAANQNIFSNEFVDAVLGRLNEFNAIDTAKVLILRGLPDVFAAGADKESLVALAEGRFHVKDLIISEKLLETNVPVIAAMEGHAVGGGLVMALCSDVIIMAEESRYGVNFMQMGFTPGMGCTRLLQLLVGPYIANEMMFTGARLKGRHFQNLVQVNYVLPAPKVFDKAMKLAQHMAEKPRAALEYLKYSVTLPKRQALQEARVHEDFMHRLTFAAPGMRERINELYVE